MLIRSTAIVSDRNARPHVVKHPRQQKTFILQFEPFNSMLVFNFMAHWNACNSLISWIRFHQFAQVFFFFGAFCCVSLSLSLSHPVALSLFIFLLVISGKEIQTKEKWNEDWWDSPVGEYLRRVTCAWNLKTLFCNEKTGDCSKINKNWKCTLINLHQCCCWWRVALCEHSSASNECTWILGKSPKYVHV